MTVWVTICAFAKSLSGSFGQLCAQGRLGYRWVKFRTVYPSAMRGIHKWENGDSERATQNVWSVTQLVPMRGLQGSLKKKLIIDLLEDILLPHSSQI